MKRLTVLLGVPTLAAALLVLSPSAANAAEAACSPAPASAVANALGIEQLHATGLNGAGLTVGVISTSYDNYDTADLGAPATTAADDVLLGALPGAANPCGYTQEVTVLQDDQPNDDEGRAMLQIVHAIAPAADLVFSTAGGGDDPASSDQALGVAIDGMVAAGVDVIVDDIMLEGDLAFATGFAAAAAQRATEAGVVYTVAAGNLTVIGQQFELDGAPSPSTGYSIGSWQTPAFEATACPPTVVSYDSTKSLECLDFDPTAEQDAEATFYVYPYSALAADARTSLGLLQWGDAPYEVTSSFSAYFLDEDGAVVTTDVITTDPTSPYPVAGTELFAGLPTDEIAVRSLVIAREVRESNTPVPVRFSFFDNNELNVVVGAEYYESTPAHTIGSTLVGRAANLSSVTVAASSMQTPTRTLEAYSGMGPQVRYFGTFDAGTAPSPLATPERREGPTVTGLDVIPTTFFGELVDGTYYYPGTSAATPVVGSTLALAMQAAPNASNEQLIEALRTTATPLAETWLGTTPAQTSGAGIVNPLSLIAAVREVAPAPGPAPAPAPAPARLPDTGASTEGGILALALMAFGLAGLAGARLRSRRRQSA